MVKKFGRSLYFLKNASKLNSYYISHKNFIHIKSPDTFVYTTADQSGFLLPQTGAYFVINHQGKKINKKLF